MISSPQTQLLVDKFDLRCHDRVVGHFQCMEVGVNSSPDSIPIELINGYLDPKLIPNAVELTTKMGAIWSIDCPSLKLSKVEISYCVRGMTVGGKTVVLSIKGEWCVC